jgi:hypothetical protein
MRKRKTKPHDRCVVSFGDKSMYVYGAQPDDITEELLNMLRVKHGVPQGVGAVVSPVTHSLPNREVPIVYKKKLKGEFV